MHCISSLHNCGVCSLKFMYLLAVVQCQGAEVSEIKKAYRQLSLKYHPDRETGDPIKFMRISKAYNA